MFAAILRTSSLPEQLGCRNRRPGRVHKKATDTPKQAAGSRVSREIPFARLMPGPGREIEPPAGTPPGDLIVSNFAVTTAHTAELTCSHCGGSMPLVRRIDLKGMPEIYIFYWSRCQHAETVKQERASRELVDAD
jgi:hypothetical protein